MFQSINIMLFAIVLMLFALVVYLISSGSAGGFAFLIAIFGVAVGVAGLYWDARQAQIDRENEQDSVQ